jgi:hypothetical protein
LVLLLVRTDPLQKHRMLVQLWVKLLLLLLLVPLLLRHSPCRSFALTCCCGLLPLVLHLALTQRLQLLVLHGAAQHAVLQLLCMPLHVLALHIALLHLQLLMHTCSTRCPTIGGGCSCLSHSLIIP